MNRNDLRVLAAQAQLSTVRCRLEPRKGPVRAPLPRNPWRERRADPVEPVLLDIPPLEGAA